MGLRTRCSPSKGTGENRCRLVRWIFRPGTNSRDNIIVMLRSYRVKAPFLAKEVGSEPFRIQSFVVGEFLLALSSEDDYTMFCRRDEFGGFNRRPRFVISNVQFERLTDATLYAESST